MSREEIRQMGLSHGLMRNSQPHGIGSAIGFIRKFMAARLERQKAMIVDPTS